MNFHPGEHDFLVDMGRWHKIASIEKVVKSELGVEWEVLEIEPLMDEKCQKYLVKAKYVEPQPRTEYRAYKVVTEEDLVGDTVVVGEDEKKEPVMGEDIFSKTQMRRVMAERDEARSENAKLKEALETAKTMVSETTAEQQKRPYKKRVKNPDFAKEKKAEQTNFEILRNCVLNRLSDLACFDSTNLNVAAVQCGAKERGVNPTRFAGPVIVSSTRNGWIEQVGERNGKKTYRLTEKGKEYIKEVTDEHTSGSI